MTTKPSVQDCRNAIIEVRKNKASDPQEFGRRLADFVDAKNVRKHPTVRHGDFEATPESGQRFNVCCRRCKIKGSIFLPDSSERSRCPKCSKLGDGEDNQFEIWRVSGFAGLIPPETKPKRFITPVSADAEDESDVEQMTEDEPVELSLIEPVAVAGDDTPCDTEPEQSDEEEGEVSR